VPRTIGQAKYYSLIEVCREVDISRSTLLRWMKAGPIEDKFSRDRRGWRVFTEMDIELIKKEANKIR
jgi:predicted site-specific integrase-resolvase